MLRLRSAAQSLLWGEQGWFKDQILILSRLKPALTMLREERWGRPMAPIPGGLGGNQVWKCQLLALDE